MTTYYDNDYLYYYDTHLRMWTIYKADDKGNQIDRGATYFKNKDELRRIFPQLQFVKANFPAIDWKMEMGKVPSTIHL